MAEATETVEFNNGVRIVARYAQDTEVYEVARRIVEAHQAGRDPTEKIDDGELIDAIMHLIVDDNDPFDDYSYTERETWELMGEEGGSETLLVGFMDLMKPSLRRVERMRAMDESGRNRQLRFLSE